MHAAAHVHMVALEGTTGAAADMTIITYCLRFL